MRRFADSFPHTDISATSFREFPKNYETLFEVERDYTFERIKLFNTIVMLDIDTFSSLNARLSAQIALCNCPNGQERETLKDLLIGRIRDVDVQQQLDKSKTDLDNTFKFALESEKGLARPHNSKNYLLTINFPILLRLNRNLLSQFSRLEENVIILKIKPIDKTRRVTK